MRYAPSFSDHIHRYAFAMEYAWKRDVLDAGCKDGFGSQPLSWVAKSITLADIEPKWLNRPIKNKSGYACPTECVLVDFNKTFPEGGWDTIVSFEVIEHVDDPDFFVKNIAEHLRPGGRLVFSVPHMVENHEHKTLFDEEKIKALISKYLTITEFYIQDKKPYSNKPLYKNLRCYLGVAQKDED